MMKSMNQRRQRNSSIELLKLLAILLIVTYHVVQTLGTEGNRYISFSDYYVDLSVATSNYQYLFISMLHYCGILGNTIFFVCSAWFFLDDVKARKGKIFTMAADVWVISIVCLVVVSVYTGEIRGSLVLQSLFPLSFRNNWYITCYILFFIMHPFLNLLIEKMSQKQLLRTAICALLLYFFIPFPAQITKYLFEAIVDFFSSHLVNWIALYFILAYMKKYMSWLTYNSRFNALLTVCGVFGHFGIIIFTNAIGLKQPAFSHTLLMWNHYSNVFVLMMVIGAFNLLKNIHFENNAINYLSSLSLYIYVIHENIMLRLLIRPAMWQYVYTSYGYNHILGWVLILVFFIFSFSLISSIIYKHSLHTIVNMLSEKTYPKVSSLLTRIESKVINEDK